MAPPVSGRRQQNPAYRPALTVFEQRHRAAPCEACPERVGFVTDEQLLRANRALRACSSAGVRGKRKAMTVPYRVVSGAFTERRRPAPGGPAHGSLRPQAAPALYRLLAESALFRTAFGACGFPLALVDAAPGQVFVEVNPAFEGFFGYRAAEARGRAFASLIVRGDASVAERLFDHGSSCWRLRAWRKDGEALEVEVTAGAVRDADGRLTHWMLGFADCSEPARLREHPAGLNAAAD